jgi:pimeloyl-ACP methyl ester carboxylesterase
MVPEGATERYVTLSHGKTRYIEAGSGPPAILLHGVGFTSGAESWLLNIAALSTRLRVLALDFLGWGAGDRLDLEYSFAYLADFVREFQDALGIDRSHIVGHSMGGWVSSVFAYESPERVDRLVLVASGGTATRTLASMTQFTPPTREEVQKQVAARYRTADINLERLAHELYQRTQLPGAVDCYQKILNHMNNGLTRQRYNTTRRLPYVKAPTLIVWGRDDTTHALEMGEHTHALMPGSRLVVFDDCGHFVPTDRPDEFNQAVLEFLAPARR